MMRIKKYILTFTLLFILTFLNAKLFAQVAINTDGSSPDGSAMLDVSSNAAGILIPRMTQADRDAIGSPAEGLMIYQTDNTPGFYYFDGSSWLHTGNEENNLWSRSGTNTYLSNTGDNVGIGITNPAVKLDVDGYIYMRGAVFSMIGEGGANHFRSYTNLNLYADYDADNSSPYSNIFFFTDGTEKMRISYNGRVGIGTQNPAARLHVFGAMQVGDNSNSANLIYLNGSGYNANIGLDAIGMKIGHNSANRDLQLLTNSTERITVKNTGEVGIATDSPNLTLSVNGYATASNYVNTIPLWQAGSEYDVTNTGLQDLSNCEAGFDASVYEPNGNVEVKLVIKITAASGIGNEFQLTAQYWNGSSVVYETPISNTDSWTWGQTNDSPYRATVTSEWKTWSAGTNAWELHLNGKTVGTLRFNSAYLLVRPAQP